MAGRVIWSDADLLGILWGHRALRQTAVQLAFQHGTSRGAICGLVFRIEGSLDCDVVPDELWLDLLHRFEGGGVAAEAVAKEFAPYLPGLTRNGVVLLVHLARMGLAQAGPCCCKVAANRDGGMPVGWWSQRQRRRVVAA